MVELLTRSVDPRKLRNSKFMGITLFTLFHNPTELRKITVNPAKKKCSIEEGSNPGSQCDGPV